MIMRIIAYLRSWFILVFRRQPISAVAPSVTPPPIEPPPIFAPRPAKWVKRARVERKASVERPHEPAEEKPKREKRPPPPMRHDDPEQWGQYYFRDAILDQLETYFFYLDRMKSRDPDAYHLHRQTGIHIMPQSAVQTFDKWRNDRQAAELSAWWKEHRPGFGAVAYGITDESKKLEEITFAEISPERLKARTEPSLLQARRQNDRAPGLAFITGLSESEKQRQAQDGVKPLGILWVPKFIYFYKFSTPDPTVERVPAGNDVYKMVVYWDRLISEETTSKKQRINARRRTGAQEYAVCVERHTGNVRVLKILFNDSKTMVCRRGKSRGKIFRIPGKHWSIGANEAMYWAVGAPFAPEDVLRRTFIEAALMYEHAALGSMVRVNVEKGSLNAVFGVEIKRTSYFFKDREITLNADGKTAKIFHIVRPHQRKTKHGTADVTLHFRGLRKFEWAGYQVSITIPGRDHFHVPEFDVGMEGVKKRGRRYIGMRAFGSSLRGYINKGFGGRA